ncbi:hypothetical protein SynA1524_01930 [Synechococcus sp. A15-24]|nr:hypothetical protein SynA1524_01930 [Synechococcus sp. A15-24]
MKGEALELPFDHLLCISRCCMADQHRTRDILQPSSLIDYPQLIRKKARTFG